MDVIAIADLENIRVVKSEDICEDIYILQTRDVLGYSWKDLKETKHEWIASKWILDYDLKVCSDYSTIEEIKNRQKK